MSTEPPCLQCTHLGLGSQCEIEWLDNTYTGHVKRRIIVAAQATNEIPAYHVHRFYCMGTEYKNKFEPEPAPKRRL